MYNSIADILEQSDKKAFWEIVMDADMESRDVSRDESRQQMKQMLVMFLAVLAYVVQQKKRYHLIGD